MAKIDNQKLMDAFNNIPLEELEYIVRYKSDDYNEDAIKVAYECLMARGGNVDEADAIPKRKPKSKSVAKRKPKTQSKIDDTEPVFTAIEKWTGFELFLTVSCIIGISYSLIVLANQPLPEGFSMPIRAYVPSIAIIIVLLFRMNYLWSVVKAIGWMKHFKR